MEGYLITHVLPIFDRKSEILANATGDLFTREFSGMIERQSSEKSRSLTGLTF